MTTISLADWAQSPEILLGEEDHRRLTVAALTDIGQSAERMDFLLYELDRARIVKDDLLPTDVVRIGSVVRYKPIPGEERTVRLVMPEQVDHAGAYRLSVTSIHGAALLGLRPGHVMSWLDPDGTGHRLRVLKVANPTMAPDPDPAPDPGPFAA
ncbi:MAG: GreA/GreB family elongation factor, partial [Devosia sp.]|nr:GreA/GreB family elongation factor [Devosia sp.]